MVTDPDGTSRPAEDTGRTLIVLGSGTAIPTTRRAPSGYLISGVAGGALLVDAGPGTLKRACDQGFPVERLRAVLLTHHHPDHCTDVISLLFALKNPALERTWPAGAKVEIVGGPGTLALLERIRALFGGWVTPREDLVAVREIGAGPFRLELSARAGEPAETVDGFALPMDHTPASLGYRLRFAGGETIAFSGDTDVCDEAVEIARGVEHDVLEASFPEEEPVRGHLTPGRAADLAERAGARHLVLSHFYPAVSMERARQEAAARFHGRLTLAEDGLRVPLAPLHAKDAGGDRA